MELIATHIDVQDAERRRNREATEAILSEYRTNLTSAMSGGGPDAIQKHKGRGKMLARERIDALIDPRSPFLEFSPLAAHGLYGGDAPSAGIVTGIGRISARPPLHAHPMIHSCHCHGPSAGNFKLKSWDCLSELTAGTATSGSLWRQSSESSALVP